MLRAMNQEFFPTISLARTQANQDAVDFLQTWSFMISWAREFNAAGGRLFMVFMGAMAGLLGYNVKLR